MPRHPSTSARRSLTHRWWPSARSASSPRRCFRRRQRAGRGRRAPARGTRRAANWITQEYSLPISGPLNFDGSAHTRIRRSASARRQSGDGLRRRSNASGHAHRRRKRRPNVELAGSVAPGFRRRLRRLPVADGRSPSRTRYRTVDLRDRILDRSGFVLAVASIEERHFDRARDLGSGAAEDARSGHPAGPSACPRAIGLTFSDTGGASPHGTSATRPSFGDRSTIGVVFSDARGARPYVTYRTPPCRFRGDVRRKARATSGARRSAA